MKRAASRLLCLLLVACLAACDDEYPKPEAFTCNVGDKSYGVGENYTDGCFACTCQEPEPRCKPFIECGMPCEHDGGLIPYAGSVPAGDGCNVCECGEHGVVTCATDTCPTCTYDGATRMLGSSFPSTDGCNTCFCQLQEGGSEAQVTCTVNECEPGAGGAKG